MRITCGRLLAATLMLALGGLGLAAQEVGIIGESGNIQFPWTQTSAITSGTFPSSNYFFGGSAWFQTPIGEDALIKVSYERDSVLRNLAEANVLFKRGIVDISVGPLVGFLNADSAPISAGIAAAIKVQWPGIAYVSLSSEGGTAISLFQTASDPQARTTFSAGVYVPHAIISGVVSASKFNEIDSGSLVSDSLTKYMLTIDIYKKNKPYTTMFELGYAQRSKYFAASSETDTLGAVMLGLDLSAQLNQSIKLLGGIETGAYVFGLDKLQGLGPSTSSFMFDAHLGFSLDIQTLQGKNAQASEEAATVEN